MAVSKVKPVPGSTATDFPGGGPRKRVVGHRDGPRGARQARQGPAMLVTVVAWPARGEALAAQQGSGHVPEPQGPLHRRRARVLQKQDCHLGRRVVEPRDVSRRLIGAGSDTPRSHRRAPRNRHSRTRSGAGSSRGNPSALRQRRETEEPPLTDVPDCSTVTLSAPGAPRSREARPPKRRPREPPPRTSAGSGRGGSSRGPPRGPEEPRGPGAGPSRGPAR